MRFPWVVLAAGAAAVAGCGGDNAGNAAARSGGAPAPNTAAPASSAAVAPAAAGPAAAATNSASPLPITGKTLVVKMIGDEKGYRFEPATLTIKVGDGLRFVNVSQGPHNVSFGTMPDASKAQLDANMPAQTSAGASAKLAELSGPLLMAPNESYTVSFAGVKPGVYAFNCTPHLALGMTGQVTVQ
jgi:plastocyanin